MRLRVGYTFATSVEALLCQSLRASLDGLAIGATIPDSQHFRSVQATLEVWIPAVLAEVHSEWRYESLDGVFPELACKIDDREAEIAGLCVLISDQTLTPFHLSLRVAAEIDDIEWFDCELGEVRRNKMVRIPYDLRHGGKLAVASRLSDIEWKYHVGLGSREDGR